MKESKSTLATIGFAVIIAAASGFLLGGSSSRREMAAASRAAIQPITGNPQLIGVEPLSPEYVGYGTMCQWVSASARSALPGVFKQGELNRGAAAAQGGHPSVDLNRAPLRKLHDTYPTYSAVAVDYNNNEVYLQDENLLSLLVYDRLANTPPSASMTEPKRRIAGKNTEIGYNCSLYVDPKNGDVYTINNDTGYYKLTIFGAGTDGNVAPKRKLHTSHPAFGIIVDEDAQELFLVNEHPPAVLVFRKEAEGDEAPLRILEGPRTKLADAHGIAIDAKNQLLFVSNHGSVTESPDGKFWSRALPEASAYGGATPPTWDPPSGTGDLNLAKGTGRFDPPSITVYPLKASGDTPPLRVIQGSNTQLNWPALMAFDAEGQELFVANDTGHSVLVFSPTDSGNVAPRRTLKGPKTDIKNPTGVYVDSKNRELWVSSMGNHRATVYPITASGDVAPLRTIRSAPLEKQAMMIGNPGSVTFDSKRDEIIVPN
jgi:6-phosphogluconolactonase (cycloisomerase 2 family)